MKSISIRTRSRTEMRDVTGEVQSAVRELGVREGAVVVFVPHTTAGILINEHADPDVARDIAATLERMVPWNGPYEHTEGNAAAHVKASLVGTSVHVIVEDGRLRLGTWQGIFFCEFDGPRSREIWVQPVGGRPGPRNAESR